MISAANDEPAQFYRLADEGSRIALHIGSQSFLIGPDFDDTDEGAEGRDFFKTLIRMALRRLVDEAIARLTDAGPDLLFAAQMAEELIRDGGTVPVKGLTWVTLTKSIRAATEGRDQ